MTAHAMYLAGQSHGNDLGESAADDRIVIENEKRPGSNGTGSRQSTTATSSSTRDRETRPMREHPSAQRLRNDEDDVDDDEQEEELPDDNVNSRSPS